MPEHVLDYRSYQLPAKTGLKKRFKRPRKPKLYHLFWACAYGALVVWNLSYLFKGDHVLTSSLATVMCTLLTVDSLSKAFRIASWRIPIEVIAPLWLVLVTLWVFTNA